MKRLLIASIVLFHAVPALAQNADEPASRDDVILYLRTMRFSRSAEKDHGGPERPPCSSCFANMLLKDNGKLAG